MNSRNRPTVRLQTGTVTSPDGTSITYDRYGSGPAVILVGGAFQYRAFDHRTAALAEELAVDFAVYHYDRRGRGDSTDVAPYSVQREVEDLQALVQAAGGAAAVFGMSSGGALALEAAKSTPGIKRIAVYEVPFIVDQSHPPLPADFTARLITALWEGHPGQAVSQFLSWVGVPAPVLAIMRVTPAWPKFKAVARTLPYDMALIERHHRGRPLAAADWADVCAPTLVLSGSKSADWIKNAMRQLSEVLPDPAYRSLDGQNHAVSPRVLAPALAAFFAGAHHHHTGGQR
jgi:pimeloyl-ACP methyl ester carboxylesterase